MGYYHSLEPMLPLYELLLALRLCNERPLIWPDKEAPSPFFSWKNFSLSTCFAGGGGIKGGTVSSRDGDSRVKGLIRGRCKVSVGMEIPCNPKGLPCALSSSSGLTSAFPFRILSLSPRVNTNSKTKGNLYRDYIGTHLRES